MSWKSLVCAGLVCVLASPVMAAPQLDVSSGGLNAAGDWVWNVTITPTALGQPIAGELGFRETSASELLTAVKDATNFDRDNPGTQIFNWETVDGEGDYVGVQTNLTLDEVFTALGSIDFPAGGAKQYLTITSAGPVVGGLTTSIEVLGKYGTGGVHGRIAEATGGAGTNYSNFSGTATRTAFAGDTNLSGGVTGADLATLAGNFGKAGNFNWGQGDFNGSTGGTGEVTGADLATLAANFGKTGGVNTPLTVAGAAGGAGAGAVVAGVPEPTSIILAAVAAMVGLAAARRRK